MKAEKHIEYIILITVVLILILCFIVLFVSAIFHNILKDVKFTDIFLIIVTFLGLFSTFFGALAGAWLSGKYSMKIAQDQRLFEAKKRINSYHTERMFLKDNIKTQMQFNRPSDMIGNLEIKGKKFQFRNPFVDSVVKQIDIDHIERLSEYKKQIIELKRMEGYHYISETDQEEVDILYRNISIYLSLCKEINRRIEETESISTELSRVEKLNLMSSLQTIYDIIFQK